MTLIPNDYQKGINKAFEISKKEIDALKAENKELNEQLRLHNVSNSIATENENLNESQNSALNITDVSGAVALLKFLKQEQQKKYAEAKDCMTANQHQYYEEGCDAVLKLIEMRFGN